MSDILVDKHTCTVHKIYWYCPRFLWVLRALYTTLDFSWRSWVPQANEGMRIMGAISMGTKRILIVTPAVYPHLVDVYRPKLNFCYKSRPTQLRISKPIACYKMWSCRIAGGGEKEFLGGLGVEWKCGHNKCCNKKNLIFANLQYFSRF